MRQAAVLAEISAGEFLASLDSLAAIYAAAMEPPPQQLPGRRAIMERHAGYRGFRGIVARFPAPGRGPQAGQDLRLAGFAYGFHGESGQWWHDLVRDALARYHGKRTARAWMSDSFEIAEVHVHPDFQGRGTGHAMLARLAEGRPEQTAVLSTMDDDTSAHRLYLGMGFADLLPGFMFPGADLPYVIMGATLPLIRLAHASGRDPAPWPPRRAPGRPAVPAHPHPGQPARATAPTPPAGRSARPSRW